jgi:hypothetical protein
MSVTAASVLRSPNIRTRLKSTAPLTYKPLVISSGPGLSTHKRLCNLSSQCSRVGVGRTRGERLAYEEQSGLQRASSFPSAMGKGVSSPVVSRQSLFLSVACLLRTIGKPVAGPESNGRATSCLWLES